MKCQHRPWGYDPDYDRAKRWQFLTLAASTTGVLLSMGLGLAF